MNTFESLEGRRLFTDVSWPTANVVDYELQIHTSVFAERTTLDVKDGVAKLKIVVLSRKGLPESTIERTYTQADFGFFNKAWLNLSSGDDTAIVTSDKPVTVMAGSGNDRVTLFASASRIVGGSGRDVLRSMATTLKGEPESTPTRVVGRARIPTGYFDVIAPSGNMLEGGAGNDTIYSRGGDDVVRGGSGRDRLILLGRGIDILKAEPGPMVVRFDQRIIFASRLAAFGIESIEPPTGGAEVLELYNDGIPSPPTIN